ncbi:MBL fold metallo-hydrolase [Kutzneria albida]|uniref:Beta-lactamase domain-containing protein n=1 Tax=Kutzneria albida DSM 43870 TaxID=1449976 RepID=W5W9M6_9PSEU|nr:MBL fold metallo-hydrolase [Kutzneria albida]AHH94909.1 beta-lactamase domain-containing protein [Kutzneria albida DSM 43870]
MSERWIEVADRVLVRRHKELDLSLGLVLGEDACLVVDTGGDVVHGTNWATEVRAVTALPWQVVITHAHFDHSFGTAAFLPCPVWAHEACRAELVAEGAQQRSHWAQVYREQGRPEVAARITGTDLVLPEQLVTDRAELDLGGRTAVLVNLGVAHTSHDLVVHVPNADVLFAGDLVEHGAPPAFEGSSPATWPAVLTRLLELVGSRTVVVPGHGEPVNAGFVTRQRGQIAAVAELATAVQAGDLPEQEAVHRSPFPAEATLAAIKALTTRNRSGE